MAGDGRDDDSRARFEALFEQAPFSVQLLAPDGRTLRVNQAWRDLWRLPDEFVERYIFGEYNILKDPLLVRAGAMPEIEKAFRGETGHVPAFPYEPSSLGFPGRKRWLHGTIFPLKDADGRVREVVLVHRDVTEEVTARERLDDALAAGNMAIWELDLATNELVRSSNHDQLYGYTEPLPKWTVGMFLEKVHPDDRALLDRAFARMFEEKIDQFESDFRVPWPDGSVHWLASRARFVRDQSGKPVVLRGTIVDVTALKQAVQARDEFLSVASHELRTPLTAMKLQVDHARQRLAREDPGFPPEQALRQLTAMHGNIDRLVRLVDDMLDISRLATGKLDLLTERTDLAELARDAVERMRPTLEGAGCDVFVRAPLPVVGSWDPLRIEQVLVNLLSNASRYASRAPVEVQVEQVEGRARLSVIDHGPGIAPADQERIFQRFERAATNRDVSGLGLGLFITREIVQQHEGTIRVESAPGHGATFIVELPIETF